MRASHYVGVKSVMGDSRINVDVTVDGSGSGIGKEMIPRANFYPKGPGQRPRSRSYSALSSHLGNVVRSVASTIFCNNHFYLV